MSGPTIEIYGTGTINRGAELMAIAISERMYATFPESRLVVTQRFGDFASRARYQLWCTTEDIGLRGLPVKLAMDIASDRVRSRLGVVRPAEIDIVLDASGFAFSDQWGPDRAERLVTQMNGSARRGKPLILLPQAFGPFNHPEVADWTRRLVARAELVFARDAQSYAALTELCGSEKITEAPDFTTKIKAIPDPHLQLPDTFSAVVPNYHMIGKTEHAAAYLEFLIQSISHLRRLDLVPLLVLHDGLADKKVAAALAEQGVELPTITHHDPRVLKWVLGRASVVVASRFHSLVSALSQGVPCLGAGWSHKYIELFGLFHCRDFMLQDLSNSQAIQGLLEQLGDPSVRSTLSNDIREAAAKVANQTEAMWERVETAIRKSIS